MATLLNLNASTFKRVIMHTIVEKSKDSVDDSATYELSTEMIEIDDDIEEELKKRMSESLGYESRSFKLKISDVSESGFFSFASKIMMANTDADFIMQSSLIASKLALSQTRSSIPGGYLIVIEGFIGVSKYVLVIKAELQNAFKSEKDINGKLKIELIRDLFLTPATRFYKIGLLFNDDNLGETYPNSHFSAHIYDDQFRPGSEPAEYFYSGFLGLSINENDKFKTYNWFTETVSFVTRRIMPISEQNRIIGAIKMDLRNSLDPILNPEVFRDRYIAINQVVSEQYSLEVLINYPTPFIKNNTLIDFSLNKKKLVFPDKIKIEGPEETFNNSIEFIESPASLDDHDFNSNEFTLIRIKGTPSAN